MEELTKLQTELTALSEFIGLRLKATKKTNSDPEYLRMVLPPYERELLAVARIRKHLKQIYDGTL